MKRLWSVFTDDMEHCYFTGAAPVERHHIFPGNPNRKNSEKYGFVVPLRYDIHPNGARFGHSAEIRVQIDNYLKCKCQKWYEEHIGSRSDFISEFGRNYL